MKITNIKLLLGSFLVLLFIYGCKDAVKTDTPSATDTAVEESATETKKQGQAFIEDAN